MPSANPPRVPKYRLHKTTGLAKVRLSGRDVYLGKHGSPESRSRYRRVVAEWLASARQEPLGPRAPDPKAPLTVNELVLAYLDFARVYYVRDGVPTGEVENLRYSVMPLVELYGSTAVDRFGPVALKAVRQVMIERDWCRSLVNGRVNRIRRVFKWGVENELVPPSVLHGLQAVSGLKLGRCSVRETEPVKPVNDDIVAATCAAAPRLVAAMVQLRRLSGMRPGEVVIMRTCDIDTSGRIWRYIPGHHKTEHHGRSRVVYLGPAAQRLLKSLLKTDLEAFIFTPAAAFAEMALAKRIRRRTPVQPSQVRRGLRAKGRRLRPRYTTTTYARAVSYACDRAFPHPELSSLRKSRLTGEQRRELHAWQKSHRWSPNQLRHSAATQLRKEFGIEAARVVLGHSSAGVTEIYAEQDLARLPEETQDHLAEGHFHQVFGRGFPTVEELARLVDGGLRTLHAMPWKADDETLDPEAGSCVNCPKRSSKHPLLFDGAEPAENGKVPKGDRCLDPACYLRKEVAHVKRCEAEAKVKHPNLKLVQVGFSGLSAPMQEAFGDRLVRLYNPKVVTAGAKNAVPVMQVDGPKAGAVVYVAPETSAMEMNGHARKLRPKDAAGNPVPIPLSERKERLKKRREAYLVGKVAETLKGLTPESLARMVGELGKRTDCEAKKFDALSLVLAFGTSQRADREDGNAAWKRYDSLIARKAESPVLAALHDVTRVWAHRLANPMSHTVLDQGQDARRMCEVLGIKHGVFETEALTAIPTPKSWAGERASAKEASDEPPVDPTPSASATDKTDAGKRGKPGGR